MDKTEHLLVCLAEEAAEIQMSVSKALRFGLWNHHPDRETTNAQDIQKECCHLVAVLEMLEECGAVPWNEDSNVFTEKENAVTRYMQLAKSWGTLQEGAQKDG